MKDAYGSTWTLQLVFGFILLFVAFLTLTISYSTVFRMKNEVITIIEKYGGYNAQSAPLINNYLRVSGYKNTGRCEGDNMIGVRDLEDGSASTISSGTRYSYCVGKEYANNNSISDVNYEVVLFYRFNIPIIGDIASFAVKGKSSDMMERNNGHDAVNDIFH